MILKKKEEEPFREYKCIIRNTSLKYKIELYSKDVFKKDGELCKDWYKRHIQKNYLS